MSIFSRFKRNKNTPDENSGKPLRLAEVFDKHMKTYVRVVNINNSVKTALILFGLTALFFNLLKDSIEVKPDDHIASIEFSGAVSSANKMGSARGFYTAFDKAINDDAAKAILIIAQSGGGSPVQGEMIHQLIKEYTLTPIEERKPVYVSVQEVCASACVMALTPADKIYVHQNSLIGSISVRMDGWAIDEALAKFDIKRKVLSPGRYKDLFDPYKSINAEEKELIFSSLLEPMHKIFVDTVKSSREGKLDLDNELLFTGMAFNGMQGVEIGLADEVRTTLQLEMDLKNEFGVETVKRYNEQGFSFANLLKTAMSDGVKSAIEGQATNHLKVSS